MGELVPIAVVDCLPGDKVRLDNEALVRFMPMIAPVYDYFNVTFHRYFIPKRLLWDHWDEYVSMTKIGTPAALPVHPHVEYDASNILHHTRLSKYIGMPEVYNIDQVVTNVNIDPMAWAAYQCVYNEFYRDQYLQAEVPYKLVDGNNTAWFEQHGAILRKRSWKRDYFTSALPFVQKGDPVMLPVNLSDALVFRNTVNPPAITTIETVTGEDPLSISEVPATTLSDPSDQALYVAGNNLETETTINDLRRANAIQRFQERLARTGSRFTEFLKGVFNVRSRDSRLQRPEYIGGSIKPVTISEVLNTTGTDDLPQGNMSGHGAAYLSGNDSNYFCEEHGIILVLMNIQQNGQYFQGIPKQFLKINHPTEIYTPDLANLGEQEIQNRELYAYTPTGLDPFGYVPRWSEHRYMPDRVSGQLATTLMHWHAGRFFDEQPQLNDIFIECDGEGSSDRIFTVEDPEEEKLLVNIFNTVQMVRPIPKLGTPAL